MEAAAEYSKEEEEGEEVVVAMEVVALEEVVEEEEAPENEEVDEEATTVAAIQAYWRDAFLWCPQATGPMAAPTRHAQTLATRIGDWACRRIQSAAG